MIGCLLMENSVFPPQSVFLLFIVLATSTSLHCGHQTSWVFLWATKLPSSSTPECHTSQIQSIFHQRLLELRVLTWEKLNTQTTDCVAFQIRRQFCSNARRNVISSFAFAVSSRRTVDFTVTVLRQTAEEGKEQDKWYQNKCNRLAAAPRAKWC